MPFRPNPNDELTIDGTNYRIAEHPAAPGMPYGQEGRAGIVYHLLSSSGDGQALKVFKARFRIPYIVSQTDRLSGYANLPGLQAARRVVLTPSRHADLLSQYQDLTYAVLMPWIAGPTWQEMVLDKKVLPVEQALGLGRSLAGVLMHMEEQGVAHCDLSGPNVMLPMLVGGAGVALIDLEGLYASGMLQPQAISSGSAGYAHQQASGGLWGPDADRFAGAVLLAEMLGWCDTDVCQASWGESYFEPKEMQKDGERYRKLVTSFQNKWGDSVVALFERAWKSGSLADCPTFGEWLVALPTSSAQAKVSSKQDEGVILQVEEKAPDKELSEQHPEEKHVSGKVEIIVEKARALMQLAERMDEQGNLDRAMELYRQAQEVALSDPELSSLANEIALTQQDLEKRKQPTSQPLANPVEPGIFLEEGNKQGSEQYDAHIQRHRKGKGWAWAFVVMIIVVVSGVVINGLRFHPAVQIPHAVTIVNSPTQALLPTDTLIPTAVILPTFTTVPTDTPRSPSFSVYDDFSTKPPSGQFSTSLWSGDSSAVGVDWQNGMLLFSSTNGGDELEANSPDIWSIKDIGRLQAALRIDKVSGGYAFTKIQINSASDLPDGKGGWWTQCRVGAYVSNSAEIICDSYRSGTTMTAIYQTSSFPIEFGKFYTVTIEVAPDMHIINYFVEGEKIGSFTPDSNLQEQLVTINYTWRIGLWMDDGVTASGEIDNVMVGP